MQRIPILKIENYIYRKTIYYKQMALPSESHNIESQ